MTSKNTDRFKIDVKNIQTNGNQTDTITESGYGSIRIKDSRYYVMYKTESATVMIRIDGDFAVVTRIGETRSDMEYRLGKPTKFLYNTPYGVMEMEILTRELVCELTDQGGVINLKYTLCDIENNMKITVSERS